MCYNGMAVCDKAVEIAANSQKMQEKFAMKRKVFNIIQIGDKSNQLSRMFDIFITVVIFSNILVMFLQTFEELAFLFDFFHVIEILTILVFCVEYVLRSGQRIICIRGKVSSVPGSGSWCRLTGSLIF